MDGNKPLAQALAPTFLDTIFFLWIRTKRNTEEMWTTLQDGVSSLFHFMVPVSQTRDKLIQVTMVIRQQLYPQASVKKVAVHRSEEYAPPSRSFSPVSLLCSLSLLSPLSTLVSLSEFSLSLSSALFPLSSLLPVVRTLLCTYIPRDID